MVEEYKVVEVQLEGLRELIEEKFKGVYKRQDEQNDHLKTLNGQVAKNTRFRARWSPILMAAWAGIGVVATFIVQKIISK